MAEEMFVRVKPYNAQLKHLVRRYIYKGVRFEESKGWYSVSADVAEYLKTVKPNTVDPLASFVFDVCTKEDAEVLERKDYEAANPTRKISEALAGAQKVTTADLARGSGEPVPVEPEPAKLTESSGDDSGDAKKSEDGKKEATPFG